MTYLVPRTYTEIQQDDRNQATPLYSQPLASYRSVDAYVLLGDPGAGKTEAFKEEARESDAQYVPARDFITFDDRPEWHNKTLFIDGLDEVRAGTPDARTPFDVIRARLERLKRPRFRLSCREADWFGYGDKERLAVVAPGNRIVELHLDPLTDEDIANILQQHPREPDVEEFLTNAEQHGLFDLLRNPQVLDMLVVAVGPGDWPRSRFEIFKLACRFLIREHNQDYPDAQRGQPVEIATQLDAAGFLFTLQLIAGNSGFALSSALVDENHPALDSLGYGDPGLLYSVAKTKLFSGDRERRTYVHRIVAEFLGARYLAGQIQDHGLPVGRVLALLTGKDGGVYTQLRGLYAWLVAHCHQERQILIDHDPLGLILYGDVHLFSAVDKDRILSGFRREADRYIGFRYATWATSPFGALATPNMESSFRKFLESPDRDDVHQVVTECVLDAMEHGDQLPGLRSVLLDVLRDDTWWPHIRTQALKVFIRHFGAEENGVEELKQLLTDIHGGEITDADDQLLGLLLIKLYPDEVVPSEILDYLHIPKNENYLGRYLSFWGHHLIDASSDEAISQLLDGMARREPAVYPLLDDIRLRDMAGKLLVRGLELFGKDVGIKRLYGWLGIGMEEGEWNRLEDEDTAKSIRAWLEANPDIQKAIYEWLLSRCTTTQEYGFCFNNYSNHIFQANPPADFGVWCLNKAKAATSEQMFKTLVAESVYMQRQEPGNDGLSRKLIESSVDEKPELLSWLKGLLDPQPHPELQRSREKRAARKKKDEEEKRSWICDIKAQETEIREGTAFGLMHTFAMGYYGHLIDAKGDTPQERFMDLFGGDDALVHSVLTGLQNTLERKDLPPVEEILRLYLDNKWHPLFLAVLAGLNEMTKDSPKQILKFSDELIQRVLIFYFTERGDKGGSWFPYLIEERSDWVAKALVRYGTALLRGGKDHVTGLYALAFDDDYANIVPLAAPPLLSNFPVRCTNKQLSALDYLLKAALRYTAPEQLRAMVDGKLRLRSMNIAQRVRWLATGLVIEPKAYQQPLVDYVEGKESRTRHLAEFLSGRHKQWSPLDNAPATTLATLIRILGAHYVPYTLDRSGSITSAMNAADFVSGLIGCLEAMTSNEAVEEMEKLLSLSMLKPWENRLRGAFYQQRISQRESLFQHPGIQQVSQTVQNGAPANVGDLAALTLAHLNYYANKIWRTDTNDYKQFWNLKGKNGLIEPRHEDDCRDTILRDLRVRLAPLGVDAQKEGYYVKDRRSDIKVSYGGANGFNVPIEIKKNFNPGLWHAIRNQLIAQYVIDPGAHGYGIYLVLWFGLERKLPPPEGSRPKNAAELKDRLEASLAPEEQRTISVCVIDCTGPQ